MIFSLRLDLIGEKNATTSARPVEAVGRRPIRRIFPRIGAGVQGCPNPTHARLKTAAVERRHEQVEEMIKTKISDSDWGELIHNAQKAAEHGGKQYLLLRFPSDLCTDGSRAINNPPNDTWPDTLRGEAAEIYQRWNATLRPHGFNLSAQVLDFPQGRPGDVGLFLRWGE